MTTMGLTAGEKELLRAYHKHCGSRDKIAKVKRVEEALVEKMENALFDVLDRNRDGNLR